MPQIPAFINTIAAPVEPGPPRADTSLGQATGLATAQEGQALTAEGQQWSNRYAEARRQSDAASIAADASQKMSAAEFERSKMSDSLAAFAGFNADAGKIRSDALAQSSDPLVQAYVGRQLGQQVAIGGANVRRASFGVEISTRAGELGKRENNYSQQLASAPDPLTVAHIRDQANQDMLGAAAAGWIPPAQVPLRLSHTLRSAIVTRSTTDPIAAQQLLEQLKGDLSVRDLQLTTMHLQPRVYTRQAQNEAQAQIASTGGADNVADAIHGVESGGQATSPTSVDGARGGWQIMPQTFRQYAMGTENIDNPQDNAAVGRRIVGDLSDKFGGDPARVAVGYFSGPGNVAPPDSPTPWLVDKTDGNGQTTSGYVAKVLTRLRPAGIPDLQQQMDGIRQRTADMPFSVQQQAMSYVVQDYYRKMSATAVQRADLGQNISNLAAGYEQGLTETPIPEENIRALYAPAQADRMVEQLNVARSAGLAFKGVQFASPEEEAQLRGAVAVPGSLAAAGRAGRALPGVGSDLTVPAGGGAPPVVPPEALAETPEQMRMRTQVTQKFDQLLAAKHQALGSDPAAYVANAPDVQARFAAIDPKDPATLAAYVDASQATQRRLGVPDSQLAVLTNGQVANMVDKLHSVDPAKGDMGAALDGIAKQYGDYFPGVMKDLVTRGKLNPDYMVLGSMDAPAQAGARQDFQRALMAQHDMGSERFSQSVPHAEMKAINDGLATILAPFRATTSLNGVGGAQLFGTMLDSVKTLAMSYAAKGMSGSEALDKAAAGLIDGKYDMNGALRVPKGMLGPVSDAAAQMQAQIEPGDLMPAPGNPNLTQAERDAIMVSAARRGLWATNASDDGAVLMGQFRDGTRMLRRSDGSPVQIKFNALPAAAARPASADITPGLMQ